MMTKKEKKAFVRELSGSVATEILYRIDDEVVPAEWGAGELRLLLADWHADGCSGFWERLPRKKRAAYRNVLVTGKRMPCPR